MRSSAFLLCFGVSLAAFAQTNQPNQPTWWSKYQYLLQNGSSPDKGKASVSVSVGGNVNVSNECGPQSETYVAINPSAPSVLAGGSNEIYRLPMRGYYSADAGLTWGGVDLPLPAVKGTNGIVFGSDPTLAFDTKGNVFYGYILVYFSAGNGINGTQMAVVRSSDGGKTYPNATFFAYEGGQNHFNDKPMITADASLTSPYRDNVYIAWDAASGGSSGGGVRLARSSDHGVTFTITRVDQPSGPGRAIGAVPFTGPNGEVYVAWNDYASGTIAFNRSFDGGATWDTPGTVALKTLAFDIAIPAEFSRGSLQYPSCAADTSGGRYRGRLYCSWMDITTNGTTDIYAAYSDDRGTTWSKPASVTDHLAILVDRFNHWLAVDPVTGAVSVSFYDTRNDTTGSRYVTDIYLTRSANGGSTWLAPNIRVSSTSSNEHDCGGVYPCSGINYGNQQGDYSGLASYNGVSYPMWVDSRQQLSPAAGCRGGLAMEEVYTAPVRVK